MEGGYRQILVMAIPLILSTGSWSVKLFADRMFLAWYSPEAIAASVPAGILSFAFLSFFIGTASYVNTFVAQYYGSGRMDRIGAIVGQGTYLAMIGGLIHLCLIPFSENIFRLIGHSYAVQQQEVVYFRILCYGAFAPIAASAMAGFYTGRGENWPVMWINAASALLNIVLDYALIFGKWNFPNLGIYGAGIATVVSGFFSVVIYTLLIFRRSHNQTYRILKGFVFNRNLFARLLRFGIPNGTQFFIDMAGITVFILLIGRLGTIELAATNIALNINTLVFMPMLGLGIAVSVLVGQNLGRNNPSIAERSSYSGLHIALIYMGSIVAAFLLFPDFFLKAFSMKADKASFKPIYAIVVVLLRFVAVYSFFDAFTIIFASSIKGAGDTRFVMYMVIIASVVGLVIPSYIALVIFKAGIYVGWTIVTCYIILLGCIFYFRFLGGKWKSMRVIEDTPHTPSSGFPVVPLIEHEI